MVALNDTVPDERFMIFGLATGRILVSDFNSPDHLNNLNYTDITNIVKLETAVVNNVAYVAVATKISLAVFYGAIQTFELCKIQPFIAGETILELKMFSIAKNVYVAASFSSTEGTVIRFSQINSCSSISFNTQTWKIQSAVNQVRFSTFKHHSLFQNWDMTTKTDSVSRHMVLIYDSKSVKIIQFLPSVTQLSINMADTNQFFHFYTSTPGESITSAETMIEKLRRVDRNTSTCNNIIGTESENVYLVLGLLNTATKQTNLLVRSVFEFVQFDAKNMMGDPLNPVDRNADGMTCLQQGAYFDKIQSQCVNPIEYRKVCENSKI